MRTTLFFFLLLIIFFSCRDENKMPKDIIARPRMQELIWDMIRADIFISDYAWKKDTAFDKLAESHTLYQQVFEIHKTSRDDFRKSLAWYREHPAAMRIILDTLQNRQNRIMQERFGPSIVPDSIQTPDTNRS